MSLNTLGLRPLNALRPHLSFCSDVVDQPLDVLVAIVQLELPNDVGSYPGVGRMRELLAGLDTANEVSTDGLGARFG